LLLASAIALLYGGYSLLLKPPAEPRARSLRSAGDLAEELSRYRRMKPFRKELTIAAEQRERLAKKKSTLFNVLNQRFEETEISYGKFASAIEAVDGLFYMNLRGMLNRIRIYDESDLHANEANADPGRFSPELRQEKAIMRNEHIAYVRSALEANEEILHKLDRLLLEISRLDVLDPEQIENMAGMREIDALIKQTKLYKS